MHILKIPCILSEYGQELEISLKISAPSSFLNPVQRITAKQWKYAYILSDVSEHGDIQTS